MTDFTFDTFDEKKTEYAKTQFLEMDFGAHIIRLLSKPHRVFVHFFKGRGSVACLGSECPVCKVNKMLKEQYPENYKSQPNYNSSSPRHYVNVLDRTPVKICPSCQTENKRDIINQYPNVCKSCGELIVEAKEQLSDKVKVANFSETIASEMMMMRSTELTESGEPLGLGNFDIAIRVSKSGGKKNITVIPTTNRDEVSVPEDALYDLTNIVIKLSAEELATFMKGVSLKDIFAARRSNSTTKAVEHEDVEQEVINDINQTLKELGF